MKVAWCLGAVDICRGLLWQREHFQHLAAARFLCSVVLLHDSRVVSLANRGGQAGVHRCCTAVYGQISFDVFCSEELQVLLAMAGGRS